MKTALLKKLCCPFDKSELNIEIIEQQGDELHEGILTCSSCSRYFPIIYGIPIMAPDEYREKSLEHPIIQKWGLELSPAEDSFVLASKPGRGALEG